MNESGRRIFNIIIALLVSVGAWTFVVYNNDPYTEVTYRDVPIIFQGENTLANRDLGVSEVSDETIDVTLKQMRIKTSTITADNIVVTADVSEASSGGNGITLKISGPENTQVADASKRSISVDVEKADSVEKPISVEYEGTATSNEPVVTSMTSEHATAIGAASEVARIDRIAALLAYEDTTDKSKSMTRELAALDENGDRIEHIVIYPGEVNFSAYTGVTKTVKLVTVTDNPDDDYVRTFTAPESVVIKGASDDVANITHINTKEIELANIYEDTEIELEYDLPEGIYLADGSGGDTIRVKVTEKESEEDAEESSGESEVASASE